MSENIHLSERLNELMEKLDLNQNQISKKSGVSASSFGKALKGASLSLDNAAKICNEFEVDANWLLLGHGTIFKKPLSFINEVDIIRFIKDNPEKFLGLRSFERLQQTTESLRLEKMVDEKIAALKKELEPFMK